MKFGTGSNAERAQKYGGSKYKKVPNALVAYISNAYSNLTASVKTKEWKTLVFDIELGVFQGDTLSPVIFLFSFNPVIELANRLFTSGFSLRIPIPNSIGLHPSFKLC